MNRHAGWLGRVAVSALVRKLVYVLLGVVLLWAGMGRAEAQVYAASCQETGEAISCSASQAMSACQGGISFASANGSIVGAAYCAEVGGVRVTMYHSPGYQACPNFAGVPCDYRFDPDIQDPDCSAKPNLGPQSVTGAMYACSGGCRYQQNTAVSVCLGDGAEMFCAAESWKATGGQCEAQDKAPQGYKPDQAVCHATGGSYQECVKPSGEHCVKGASGQQLCWTPTSLGERMTTDGTLAGNRQEAPSTPTPPANQQNPTNVTTTTTTVGGNTYNTSISTGTGSKPGQSDTGVPGDKDGDGKKDDGEGDEDGPGGVGSGVGSLYEGNGKTVSSVYATFKTQMEGTAIVGAAGNFLTVSVGGSCPSWTVPATAYWEAMPFDWLCSGPLSEALAFGAYLLLAIAAYTAFKIGFG